MMKKLMLIMFVALLISSVSAAEFDNSKDYDEETKTITVTNLFGLGDEIARIQLGSPLDFKVPIGEEILVAWYELENLQDYDGLEVFDIIETLDLNRGNSPIQKNILFKQKQIYIIEVPVYDTTCSGSGQFDINGTEIEECITIQIGTQEKKVEEWKTFNKNDLLESGNYTIGLFTEVEEGEIVEWIPTMYGIEIYEWASWTGALNVGIVSYYKLDAGSGEVLDDVGNNNGQNIGATRGINGQVGNAFTFDGSDSYVNISTTNDLLNLTSFTISMWINRSELSQTESYLIDKRNVGGADSPFAVRFFGADDGLYFHTAIKSASENDLSTPIKSNQNYFVVFMFDYATGVKSMYFNNLLNATVDLGTNVVLENTNASNFTLGGYANRAFTTRDWTGMIDEVGIWNRTLTTGEMDILWNSGVGLTRTAVTSLVSVSLNSPPNNTIIFNIGDDPFDYYSSNFTATLSNLSNATLNIWDSSGTLVKTNFTTITGLTNFTNLTIGGLDAGMHYWNYEVCGTNATFIFNCSVGVSNRTLDVRSYRENGYNFNNFTTETDTETFIENVTFLGSLSVTTAKLFYNGTSSTGTSTASGNDYTLSKTDLDIPLIGSEQNRTFFWSVTLSNGENINLTTRNQTTQTLNFTLCNAAPLAVPYINFTFKNETVGLEDINASIPSSTWYYYLGSGTVNKTLIFSNASENTEYAFCGSPADQTINVVSSLNYVNSESQQRTFSLTSGLSNVTLNQLLYLLPTTAGLFSPFRAEDSIGNSIQNVKGVVSRTIGGNSVTITSGFTDSSGFITYFLNPDFSYSGLFTKSGYPDNSFTFTPTADLRTVIMGSSSTSPNGTTITTGTNITILPTNNTLANQTSHTFSFEVASGQTITFISLNITNSTRDQVLFSSNAGAGTVSGSYNPQNDTRVYGEFIYKTATETISYTRTWLVGSNYAGDYSMFRQLTFFTGYGFSDFWRILIVLIVMMGTLIFMSSNTLTDTSESKIVVAVLIIWFFSIVGWLDNPAIVSSTGFSQYSKQYGIAILVSFAGFFFIARRLFIRRI